MPRLPRHACSDDPRESASLLSRKPPIAHRWNLIPILLTFCYTVFAIYYFYVRFTQLLPSGWAIYILIVELLGVTSFFPYALLITRSILPTGSPGLPEAKGAAQNGWLGSKTTAGLMSDTLRCVCACVSMCAHAGVGRSVVCCVHTHVPLSLHG